MRPVPEGLARPSAIRRCLPTSCPALPHFLSNSRPTHAATTILREGFPKSQKGVLREGRGRHESLRLSCEAGGIYRGGRRGGKALGGFLDLFLQRRVGGGKAERFCDGSGSETYYGHSQARKRWAAAGEGPGAGEGIFLCWYIIKAMLS